MLCYLLCRDQLEAPCRDNSVTPPHRRPLLMAFTGFVTGNAREQALHRNPHVFKNSPQTSSQNLARSPLVLGLLQLDGDWAGSCFSHSFHHCLFVSASMKTLQLTFIFMYLRHVKVVWRHSCMNNVIWRNSSNLTPRSQLHWNVLISCRHWD